MGRSTNRSASTTLPDNVVTTDENGLIDATLLPAAVRAIVDADTDAANGRRVFVGLLPPEQNHAPVAGDIWIRDYDATGA